VVVGDLVEDGAPGLLTELIELLTGEGTAAEWMVAFTRLEAYLESLLGSLELTRDVGAGLIGHIITGGAIVVTIGSLGGGGVRFPVLVLNDYGGDGAEVLQIHYVVGRVAKMLMLVSK